MGMFFLAELAYHPRRASRANMKKEHLLSWELESLHVSQSLHGLAPTEVNVGPVS